MEVLKKEEKDFLLSTIRDVPDFPKPGIIFKDITTLLNNKKAFSMLMKHLKERYVKYNLDYVAGIESRGFIFGSALAMGLEVGFVPVRKKDKLPYTTISEKYSLEYGFDEVEIHIDAFHEKEGAKVLLIDDLIATGGTASAAASLIEKAKAKVVEACFIMDLKFISKENILLKKITDIYSVLEIE
jgi:adenine phosphoribosyltransferase